MSCRPTYDPCLDGKLNQIGSYAAAARYSAEQSAISATSAATSAEEAAQSEEAARLYLGAFAVAPTTNNEGGPLEEGMLYFNTVSNLLFVWNGTSWSAIQTDDIYLGGFSVAPILNNQGLPLVSGNLYWNTASNNLWAHNGTSWLRTNFNETTPFFTQFTSGSGIARSLEVRMRQDISSVRDWGATGSPTGDDTLAIQNAIAFSFSDYVYFPPGTYRVTAPIVIEKPIRIIGAGSQKSIILIDHSGNGIVFQPVGAGSSNVFLNFPQMENISVSRPDSITTPQDNIWIRQCNGFKANNVSSFNGNTCFRISGGQLNSLDVCRAFVSNTSIVKASENAGVLIEDAELGGGLFQKCFTINISNLFGTTSNVLDHNIKVRSVDGLNINNVYLAFANISHIEFKRQRTTSDIAGINITNSYLDCTGFFPPALNTPYAIRVFNALPAGNYGVTALNVSDCILANNAGDPSVGNFNALVDFVTHGVAVSFKGCYFANSGAKNGVELYDSFVGGPSGSYVFSGNTFKNLSNDLGGTAIFARDVNQLIIDGNNFINTQTSSNQVFIQGTCGTLSAVGNITDGSAAQMVTINAGTTFTGNAILLNAGQTSTNIVQLALPTSSAGLPSGAMWNNAGVVNIVP